MSEELYSLYEKTVDDNLRYLYALEKKLTEEEVMSKTFLETLSLSSKNLSNKWRTGAKYLRTKYAKLTIPNYPEHVLKPSIFVDATINLLDDILDETMDTETKALYLVELIRVLAVHSGVELSREMTRIISDYFNKIIFIAVSERYLYTQASQEKDEKKVADLFVKSYFARSLDMDVFIELPLAELGADKEDIENILECSRIFRVVNLTKKDTNDLPHDLKFGIFTPLSIMANKKIDEKKFIKRILELEFPPSKLKSEVAIKTRKNLGNLLKEEKEELRKIKGI